MMEDTLESIESSLDEAKERFYGVAVGKVINVVDPLMLGRVQVQIPFIDSLDLSPWARIAQPMAGISHGFYFVPNIDDEVLIAFEQGDVNAPYIIGSLWNSMAPPPLPSPLPQIRAIRTLAGNQIVFTEAPPSVTIQTAPTAAEALPTPPSPAGPHHTLMLSSAGVQMMSPIGVQIVSAAGTVSITVGSNVISVTPAGITINGSPNLTLSATGVMNLTAPTINITGGLVKIN